MANVYDFRPGRSMKNVNPQSVGDWLQELRGQHKTLTPEIVVEAAKDPDSPGHNAFTWDVDAAAHQHWLNQARRLIVSIRILNPPTARPTVAFVSVKTPDQGRSYVPTVEALNNEQLRERLLSEARTFIEGLERRYSHFVEVAELLGRLKQAAG